MRYTANMLFIFACARMRKYFISCFNLATAAAVSAKKFPKVFDIIQNTVFSIYPKYIKRKYLVVKKNCRLHNLNIIQNQTHVNI